MLLLSFAYTLLSTFIVSYALPALDSPTTGEVITSLPEAEIAKFRPYSYYASTGNCNPSLTRNWTCGTNCEANPTFEPVASGGDGDKVQFWFVGYDPTLDTVVVSHQGTDFSKIKPVLTDIDLDLRELDSGLFRGVSQSVKVHHGFRDAHARAFTRSVFQHPVLKILSSFKDSSGAAIALLDSVFLALHLPNVVFKTVVYAMPRVGNQAFANYVDEHLHDLRHINNKRDPVPILPGMFLGYHQPSGEIHIGDDDVWYVCPGQDNTSELCSTGAVRDVLNSRPGDHVGPFNGAIMTC
ncbi:hypothetical protein NLI96_g5674 [Meripilus lineatus]|uniref:Fungal lipase-type domain-containing protein n=1 Tax=Meripilus lineatus TaxID=2056292 RepID=A0AAD5V346_9APHY|nr:hypothetical protein NLI96_g5674 [Physisporinus lineatus]